jgi:hypothetical protein
MIVRASVLNLVHIAAIGLLAGCASGSRDASALAPPDQGWNSSGKASQVASTQVSTSVSDSSAQPPPSTPRLTDPWPRDVALDGADALIYQPQIESWKGNALLWRVAVALRPTGQKAETFGVIWGAARTDVDRITRTVELNDLTVSKVNFPTLQDKGETYLPSLRTSLASALQTMALDSLEASLAASHTVHPPGHAVRNSPPRVIVAYGPAILVPIEGKPVIKPIADTRFERIINTQAMIARTKAEGTWYLHVYDGWVSSPSLSGPWSQLNFPPFGLDDQAKQLAASGTVDLLDGGEGATPKPTLASGVPAIHVTEEPTELILFKGQPNLVPVTGTPLLWATNSATDVIVDTSNNAYYVLMAGRWFRAPGLGGPWTFVASNDLPPSFKQIPARGTPASIVLASVAGTPQAQEAVIENSIPQTAAVARNGGPKFTPEFDGVPQWRPVAGTPLRYVVNSKVPIIEVSPSAYYAVTGGVWFSSGALTGPWLVATSVPAVIYTIPVASPLHYVTYVHVYGFTDTVVYTGYTPGYLGTVVDVGGTVVYGTGYAYDPWIGSVWYGAPVTYGVAAMPVYNPYVGFTFGFAMGLTAAYWAEPYWGGAYYHAGYYGYPCCGSASANVYRSWPGGVSSGTRTYWADNGGAFGTTAAGNYSTYRGTSGTYNAQRSWNPYTGQGSQAYNRTFNTASGTTGSVTRQEGYNAQTGQRTYGSNVQATGAGGSSVDRNVSATAGPQGDGRDATTTTYNAKTGQTKTWNNGVPQNSHYAGADGNVYRSDGNGGWQQHSASGWGSASGDTSWASREQQARGTASDRTSAWGGGGWDRSGSGGGFGGGGWASRFGGSADRWGGGSGSWGSRFSGGSFGDRFGGGGFRGGGFRR